MSLSREPSPRPGGGWSSPGLTTGSGSLSGASSPRRPFDLNEGQGLGLSWASAKAKSDQVRGYPSFSTRNNGFFSRQKRRISASLPRFRVNPDDDINGKARSRRWGPGGSLFNRLRALLFATLRRKRVRLLFLFVLGLVFWLIFASRIMHVYHRSPLGGGSKIVLIVASNVGGGVMELKGAREWAIERDSLKNKRNYVARWGYDLEIVNMVTKKRYAHEWRESWEKVDVIRNAMAKYPKAEWFWWMDLNTYIMEPSYSLQSHIFDHFERHTYRDINLYNPLNISHPPTGHYLDPISRSAVGDNDPKSVNVLLAQDCSGFNLGSFFVRRSAWTDQLLDIWWDPVMYEQRHMQWDHKEQDALEHLYATHPWVRPHIAFLPQRRMNSFPPGACGDGNNENIHYQQDDRDFVVNMAGCEWGRDCWAEMYNYRQLANWLQRSTWDRFRSDVARRWKRFVFFFRGR